MVRVIDNCRKIIAGRSGDHDLLGACVDVSLSLRLGGIEAGALENDVDVKIFPRKVVSVRFLVDRDLLTIDNDVVLTETDSISLRIAALGRIILQKVCKHFRRGQIVDRDDLKALCLEHLTECQTADTAKTIDCDSYCHNPESSCI